MKRTVSAAIMIVLCLGVSVSASRTSEANISRAIRPGNVVMMTRDGYVPTLFSLLPDIPFAKAGDYKSWRIKPLRDMYQSKAPVQKTATHSFLDDIYIMSFPDSVDVISVLQELKKNVNLRYVEPDYRLQLYGWPVDSLFNQQWYLNNTGQEFYAIERKPGLNNDILYLETGKPGEDIGIAEVYDATPADNVEVIIAIIDTGIDYGHPDLAGKIFINANEIPDNGIDDDHNGFVDDYRGWDFAGDTITVIDVQGDNDATDSIGHGTHVSGLVAAVQNEIGVAGYPGNIKILPIKIFPNGFQSVAMVGIIYAADMGAFAMNMSWGFPFESQILREAILYAVSKGTIPVAAAGNFGDSRKTYPAAFDTCFTVGGTNDDGFMTYFSSFGPFLDLSAPAQNILSLRAAGTDLYESDEPGLRIIAEKYLIADGTSMSAPIVTGACGMLKSFNPALTPQDVLDALRQTATDLTDPFDEGDNLPGYDTLSGWGRLDVGAAFNLLQAPAAYITAPRDGATVFSGVLVGLGTTGGYNGPVDLYFGEGSQPQSWTLLRHDNNAVDDPNFFFWFADGRSGPVKLRLDSDAGSDYVDLFSIDGVGVELTSPGDDQEVKYLVAVHGSAYSPQYDSTVLYYRTESSSSYKRLFSSTGYYFDEAIYEWPISNVSEGNVYLKLSVFDGGVIYSDSVRVMVRSAMRTGFPANLPGYAGFSPGCADIDGDGKKEIAAGCRNGLFAYKNDGTIMPGFPVLTSVDMRSIPAFDDVDGDGLLDIIITGNNIVACVNYLGEMLPGWPRTASTGMSFFTFPVPVPTLLSPAEDSAIVYITKYGEVRAYRYNGDSYFYSLDGLFTALDPNIFDTSLYAGLTVPVVTATDMENDGHREVVGVYSTSDVPSGYYLWDSRNGLPADNAISPLRKSIRISDGGLLADIDEDGYLEIIMCGTDTLGHTHIWVTEESGADVPGWPVALADVDDWIGTNPICADIDGNGSKEVMVAFYGFDVGRIYVYNADGTPYIQNPGLPEGVLISTATSLGNVIAADIDGNGYPNIISRGGYIFPGTGFERIFAWEPNGSPTPGYPIVTPTAPGEVTSLPFTPIIDDLDGDGLSELIMTGDGGDIFVFDLDATYDSAAMTWPKFAFDAKNSSINPRIAEPTDAGDNFTQLPLEFQIVGNYPNPFNPSTTIEFTLDRAREVRLDIFNVLGQKVTTLVNASLPAGVHRVVWNGTDGRGDAVASGVYMAFLAGEERRSTRKLVLLK